MGSAVVGTCSALFGSVTMPSYLWLTPARRTCDLPRVNPHPSSLSSLRSLQSALHLSNLQRHLSTALSLGEGPRAPFKKVQSLTEDGKVSNSFFFFGKSYRNWRVDVVSTLLERSLVYEAIQGAVLE